MHALFFFVPIIYIFCFFRIREKNMPFNEKKVKKFLHFLSFNFILKGGSLMARSSRLESGFQDKLRKELEKLFPGCMVFKMDQIQGIPDLLVLYKNKWASLECKRHAKAKRQPNQEYYVGLMNAMSFARFICPENKEEVLHDLSEAFKS